MDEEVKELRRVHDSEVKVNYIVELMAYDIYR
jgi:hypothetical protein